MADYIVLITGPGNQHQDVLNSISLRKTMMVDTAKSATLIIGEEDAPEIVYVPGDLTESSVALVAKLAKETGAIVQAKAGLPDFAADDEVLFVHALETTEQNESAGSAVSTFLFDLILLS